MTTLIDSLRQGRDHYLRAADAADRAGLADLAATLREAAAVAEAALASQADVLSMVGGGGPGGRR